jgi:hypothetical protein
MRDGLYISEFLRSAKAAISNPPALLLTLLFSAGAWAGALDDKRRADLADYLDFLAAGGSHNALQAEALADLSFKDLKAVITAYTKAADLEDSDGFQKLLLRNSEQYLLGKELLKLYAPDFLEWLAKERQPRVSLFNTLAASARDRQAADLAVRLVPAESLIFIHEERLPFRKALLQAWCRHLSRGEDARPIERMLMQAVLRLADESEDFLLFKGYWRSVQSSLMRQLQAPSRATVMQALRVQAIHPQACKYNPAVIRKWTDDSEVVIQALKNIGKDRVYDHAKALAELWPELPDDDTIRYWCLYAIAAHPSGNQDIVLQAITDIGYPVLDLSLSALQDSPEALKQGIQLMLDHHKAGYSKLFRYAAMHEISGFESAALKVLGTSEEQGLQRNAITYLGQGSADTRVQLLDYLGHPKEDIRLAAIKAFSSAQGLDKPHRDRIAPMLIQVFQSDTVIANRQEALYVLGQWELPEFAPLFRQQLARMKAKDYGGAPDGLYRTRLMCWLGLARLGKADALAELSRIHKEGTVPQRLEVLLAYRDIGTCTEFAFTDLAGNQPKLVATAAALIREHGDKIQRKRLAAFLSGPYWWTFSHSYLDEHGIVSHAGHGHAH